MKSNSSVPTKLAGNGAEFEACFPLFPCGIFKDSPEFPRGNGEEVTVFPCGNGDEIEVFRGGKGEEMAAGNGDVGVVGKGEVGEGSSVPAVF